MKGLIMKKINAQFYLLGLIGLTVSLMTACSDDDNKTMDVFNTSSNDRNLTVVISDLHLGANLDYAEINANLAPLENLLHQINESRNVKELIIAGDLIDEWFVPATVDTYAGKDQADFVERIGVTNKGVIDAFKQIIANKNVTLVYTPGNHDLTITADNVSKLLPGIKQARDDDALGLGTYSPEDYPKIAIEHGHRYNIFCAPDPISNQIVAPGTILPPGYFFTRIAAQHVFDKTTESENILLPVTDPASSESQNLLYQYWGVWAWTLHQFPIKYTFDNKMIVTNIDGFTENYSVNDLLPEQAVSGGLITVDLFDGVQDTWEARSIRNHVAVPISAEKALAEVATAAGTDTMADLQYFKNADSDKRIVIFGHTHDAKIIAFENLNGEKSIYANSGTWIDHNPEKSTMNFVIVTPQTDDSDSQTNVAVYNFENETVTEMAQDSLRL